VTKTKTDPGVIDSVANDEPMQLREWGSDRIHPLPPARAGDWVIGSSSEAWLQLQDREQFVSRRHAALRLEGEQWSIVDLSSKNGLWLDGMRTSSASLMPGCEIGIGRLRLIVETPRIVRQRALLARLLGWHPERRLAVDRALHLLREFVAARVLLWLTGADDLISVARRIHREVAGDAHPFVVGDLERGTKSMEEALRAARGGTLCIWARKLPADAIAVRKLASDREPQCRMIVCARSAGEVMSIDIPALSTRPSEIGRIIDEYAVDAIKRLGAKPTSFNATDRELLVENPPTTLADIELTTFRMVAIREYGGVTHAAPRLGVTHSALSRWLARRVSPRRRSP